MPAQPTGFLAELVTDGGGCPDGGTEDPALPGRERGGRCSLALATTPRATCGSPLGAAGPARADRDRLLGRGRHHRRALSESVPVEWWAGRLALVVLTMAAATALAGLLPAHRAVRVSPVAALGAGDCPPPTSPPELWCLLSVMPQFPRRGRFEGRPEGIHSLPSVRGR